MKFFFDLIVWSEFSKSHAMRASVFYVPTCQSAKSLPTSHFYVLTCQRAKGVSIVQLGVPTCQMRANISTSPAKRRTNFSTMFQKHFSVF